MFRRLCRRTCCLAAGSVRTRAGLHKQKLGKHFRTVTLLRIASEVNFGPCPGPSLGRFGPYKEVSVDRNTATKTQTPKSTREGRKPGRKPEENYQKPRKPTESEGLCHDGVTVSKPLSLPRTGQAIGPQARGPWGRALRTRSRIDRNTPTRTQTQPVNYF